MALPPGAASQQPSSLYSSSSSALLSPTYIRLLEIQAIAENDPDDAPIICNMVSIDLDDQPAFNALSYVWGTMSVQPTVVYCNGTTVEITDNCYSALLHLRKRYGLLRIWIDTFCINQHDEREKEIQIALMGDIYMTAEQVIVWLGTSTAASDRAMTYMSDINILETSFRHDRTTMADAGRAILKIYFRRWDVRNHISYIRRYRAYLRGDSDQPPPSTYLVPEYLVIEDLQDLLCREWIQRIWTYQEIILAKSPILICGHRMVTWAQFQQKLVTLHFVSRREKSMAPLSSILVRWKDIGLTREQLSPPSISTTGRPQKLHYYRLFVKRIAKCTRIVSLAARLLAGYLLLFIIMIVYYIQKRARDELPPSLISSLYAFCSVFFFLVLDHNSARWSGQSFSIPDIGYSFLEQDQADLVSAICFRRALNPKDKAFGVYAILEALSGEEACLPDYMQLHSELYKATATQICRSSTGTQLLTAAAEHQLTDGPSWVPDWSKSFSDFWLRPETIKGHLHNASTSGAYQNIRSFEYIVEANGDVVKVFGKRLCRVDDCRELQRTAELYETYDDEKHLHNLGIMAWLFDTRYAFNTRRRTDDFDFNLFRESVSEELIDLFTTPDDQVNLFPGVTKLDMEEYLEFLQRHYYLEPPQLLQTLRSDQVVRVRPRLTFGPVRQVRYGEIFNTHIAVCNSISSSGRKFLSTISCISLGSGLRYGLVSKAYEGIQNAKREILGRQLVRGICSDKVLIGDEIILVVGNHMPLVTRQGHSDTVRLVSPAIVFGAMQGQAWPHPTGHSMKSFIRHQQLLDLTLEAFRIS